MAFIITDRKSGETVDFGAWRFNAATGDLDNAEINVRLEPQVASLLAYFLAHQDRLVTRAELNEELWDGRAVSDDAINRCIFILRQTLSPENTQAYIETMRRRGYVAHFPPPQRSAEPRVSRAFLRPVLLTILAGLVLFAAYRIYQPDPEVEQRPARSFSIESPVVAVLPFTSSGEGGESAFFADGIHDDLLTQLAQMQSLRVISRTSVLPYRDADRNLRAIGKELGADAVLEGNVQQMGDSLRINMQLIDARSDEHLWAQRYDRDLSPEGIFTVQAEIAAAVAGALRATLSEQDSRQLAILPTQNLAAYRAYHQALQVRGISNVTDPAYEAGLRQAVSLDPAFVRAWSELAGVLSFRYFSTPDDELVEQVERINGIIREHAPDSAEHLIAQSYYTYYILQDYTLAHQLINRAHELRPGDLQLLELKSWIERRLGNFDARLASIRLARQLDPLNPERTRNLVFALIGMHEYEQAMAEANTTTRPDYNLEVLKALLAVNEHQDFDRWVNEVRALQSEFGREDQKIDLFEPLIAARDHASLAALWLSAEEDSGKQFGIVRDLGESDTSWERHQLMLQWLLNDEAMLEQAVKNAQALLDRYEPTSTDQASQHLLLSMFIAAVSGADQAAQRRFRDWEQITHEDQAILMNVRHLACRALGIAAASTATVRCLGDALTQPSFAVLFVEPYLPFYDPVRSQPAFQALMEELPAQ